VTFRTFICADVGQSGGIAIETLIAVETISLIDFLCPWIVGAEITGILLLLINDVISLWRAIVARRALNCSACSVGTQIARLATDTISNLLRHDCNTLCFEGTRNRCGLTFWTI